MWNAVTRQFQKTNTYIHNLDEKCHFTLHFWLFTNCKVFVCQLLDSKICPQTMHKLHITYLIKFNFGLKHRRDPAICSYLRFSLWYFHASIRRILWQTYGPKYGWVERAICGIHLSTNLSISVDLTLCLSIQLKCNSIPSEGILSTIRVFDFKCFKVLIRFTFALQPKTLVTNDFNLWIMMEAQATHFQCCPAHTIKFHSGCISWSNRSWVLSLLGHVTNGYLIAKYSKNSTKYIHHWIPKEPTIFR